MLFLQSLLRGLGQVMFQNNWISGLLFLIGVFYNSWLMGLGALAGTLLSTVLAKILKYQKQDIAHGLYGFNGALTGIALVCFFEVTLLSLGALAVAALLSTVVTHELKRIILPFTAPFVVVTWSALYALIFIFQLPLATTPANEESTGALAILFSGLTKGCGQVMFQDNIVTGLIFIVGIFINDRLNGAYAVYATLLGFFTGWVFAEPAVVLHSGLMGYNAILCAIALSAKGRTTFLWITAAIVLSTILNIGLAKTGLITLTAPFVLTTWLILNLRKSRFFNTAQN